MNSFLRKRIFFVLCAVSLAYTLPVYNKYWAPLDEGVITVAAQRLLAGQMPYKDFFILMYPPGQVYALAFIFKLFSSSLIAGRIYAVLVSVGISVLVFYMTHLLTRKLGVSMFSWFVVLVSLVPRLGAIPAPIWPGVFLSLLTIYIYMQYLRNLKYSYIVFAGFIAGLSVLFRHDLGIFAFTSILGALFISAVYNKEPIGKMIAFIISTLIVILPWIIYFISKSASRDMINALLLFPFIHQKTAALPFPRPCIDLNMVFHGSLHFITINQYYLPILVYIFIFTYLLNTFFKKRVFESENLMLLAIFLFGVLSFNQVRIRTDPAHLLTVIQPSVVLFGFIMHKTFSYKFNLKVKTVSIYIFSAIIIMLFVLLSIKNIDKYIKNGFRKVYKKDIIGTRFDAGTIYVPKEERNDVLNTLNFIKKNTRQDEKIYIGNVAHWKDDFGGSTILYFLADRLPSTKYYELVPGLVTNPDVHREIKDSLLVHNVNIVILQDIDLSGLDKKSVSKDRLVLDNFIQDRYRLAEKFGKYNIYVKK